MDSRTDDLGELSFDQLMELERRAEARAGGDGTADDDDPDHGDADDDGVIVLPWWQHPVNIVTLVVTAAILAAMVGWMIGDNASREPHNDVDTGFLQDMRLHHEQAIFMGFVYRDLPDTSPEIGAVAASIVQGQSIEVGRMIQLLREFGEAEARDLDQTAMTWMGMAADATAMPGMASDAELDALIAASGEEADELFVELMIEHHQGGIEMAEYAVERAANDEVRRMAASMASSQRGEIAELLGLLD
ncbi:MAG: DUF305 domain-containing protein [Acidimicrobiia bacterium]